MRFNKMIFLGLAAIVNISLAVDVSIWTVEKDTYSIYYDKELDAYLSIDCLNKKCGAKTFLLDSKKMFNSETKGESQNPGSYYCAKLQGKVLIARNENKSESALCQASDRSVIVLTSLGN